MTACLFLASLVALASAEVVNINKRMDEAFDQANQLYRRLNLTTYPVPKGKIGKVTYSDHSMLGMDSIYRTNDCTMDVEGTTFKFDLRYGLKLWEQSIGSLNVGGDEMSAAFRVRDNSVRFGFTVYNTTDCHVSIDDLKYETFTKVEFGSSRPEYDGINVDDFFTNEILPAFNQGIETVKPSIEKSLQPLCQYFKKYDTFGKDLSGLEPMIESIKNLRYF